MLGLYAAELGRRVLGEVSPKGLALNVLKRCRAVDWNAWRRFFRARGFGGVAGIGDVLAVHWSETAIGQDSADMALRESAQGEG
jgi:hypothetical protein